MEQAHPLLPATHTSDHHYWEGGHYELNLSFDTLRDKQWSRALQTIWNYSAVRGPLEVRYIPNGNAAGTTIATPPPTATQTQHGALLLAAGAVGCNVMATRSLFECISLLVPLGMFADLDFTDGNPRSANPALEELDSLLLSIAMSVYDVVPFRLAVVGYERECQVVAELRSDAGALAALRGQGAFLAQDEILTQFGFPLDDYEPVRSGLRWAAPRL